MVSKRVVFILWLLEPLRTDWRPLESSRLGIGLPHFHKHSFSLLTLLKMCFYLINYPTTDLPEVLSYILGFAMYDLPESSCRVFLEKPDRAILPQPICRKCCKLQWEWQFTTFLTLLSRVLKKRRHIYSKKRIFQKGWHLH